ncbi:MAG: hypothetical protein NTY19_06105 [Planctomycetota bacterium]|nr:hypothetical protein [Planctomycetota bacterium]
MISTTWTPPSNPNPPETLHSAVIDKHEGSYEQALAKFLWFHNNAKQYDRGVSAVRLSFALGYWLDLATVYPPARDAFIQTRDETEVAFRENLPNFDLFQEIAAMNSRLGEGIRTADLFAHVAERDDATARRLYHVAESELIAAGRYRACATFLDSKKRLEHAAASYRVAKRHEESRPQCGIPVPKLARRFYVENVATLVALLIINDRPGDARMACNEALQVVDDDDFRLILEAAMAGHLPSRSP